MNISGKGFDGMKAPLCRLINTLFTAIMKQCMWKEHRAHAKEFHDFVFPARITIKEFLARTVGDPRLAVVRTLLPR
jgi:hypothetical protein